VGELPAATPPTRARERSFIEPAEPRALATAAADRDAASSAAVSPHDLDARASIPEAAAPFEPVGADEDPNNPYN